MKNLKNLSIKNLRLKSAVAFYFCFLTITIIWKRLVAITPNVKCIASKGLITKNYQNMKKEIESNTPETPQQPLLAIHGVMPRCSLCKFWKQTTFYEYSVNEGDCDKLNKTDKVNINLHLGWDGGYVNDIETEADFYCALFSYNGA